MAALLDALTDDAVFLLFARLAASSLADLAAASCTCRRLARLARAHAPALLAPLADAVSAARRARPAAHEAEQGARATALAALGAALAPAADEAFADRWMRELQRGPCRVADGAWCSHGLCASTPRAPRPKPGVAMLLEAAVEGLGGGARACNAACALATVLEAAGAPRLALRQWLALAEPPAACPRAQLRVALHHHSGIRGASELRVARPDRGSTARAHAAASAFGKVGANPHARPEEAALAGTYLGFMHLDALGLPKCDSAARRCFVAAARLGSVDAAEMLRELDAERGWPPFTRASASAASRVR
ncbi:hypothetical protein KFE25_011497 [Diacronema lutheri]|uniref:F-box domain-containing protein n=1 Tax=Diacronema lutheri TaxID=2081491 RepID=A0A8J5XIV9_DIALT|nr:hypothetical protein KFE25_011497 [Diacronema lutheri]